MRWQVARLYHLKYDPLIGKNKKMLVIVTQVKHSQIISGLKLNSLTSLIWLNVQIKTITWPKSIQQK